MSRRAFVIWPLLLMAFGLGGCSTGDWDGFSADIVSIGGNMTAAEPVVAVARPDPGAVVSAPVEPAGLGGLGRQSGYIVEHSNPVQRPYILDTGDRLRVFVYGQPNLSRIYPVDQSGNISVPLIGTVRARGLTSTQLEGSIRSRLAQGLVRDPQVTVDVQQNRPFFILGEVRNAGQFPYVTGMTVQTAVAIAGGFGERANERKARLTRRTGGITEVIDVTPETELEPGDTVYIYERFL